MDEQSIRDRFRGLPETLTVKELCDVLRQDMRTVYRKLNGNVIPAIKEGRNWIIFRDSVCEWLIKEHQKTSTPESDD